MHSCKFGLFVCVFACSRAPVCMVCTVLWCVRVARVCCMPVHALPSMVTTQLFGQRRTAYLTTMLFALNLIQYVLHLASTVNFADLEQYGSKADLAGIG
jgi:hypothetical protein